VDAADPAHLPAEAENVREVLATMDARLASCIAAAVFPADPTPAQKEVLRAIRSRAAVMTLQCIGLMLRCACAVLPSALLRVHLGALRPREVGSRDPATDAVLPAICRVLGRRKSLILGPILLWLVGTTCKYVVLFDRFEQGSKEEWVACGTAALMLPYVVCLSASLNAKTARQLLKEFETLYVIAYVLGMVGLCLFLFREHPAKIVALSFGIPSWLLSAFLDASAEGSRLLTSRAFFTLNAAALMLYLALVSLNLGVYIDYTFQFGTFTFVASSMLCSAVATLLVFGVKSIAFSFFEPGSLVVLTSAVCCVFLDADSLAVLKGSYLLIGQSFGKFARNKTIDKYLKRQRNSIAELTSGRMGAMQAVAPAPTPAREPEAEPPNAVTVVHSADAHLLVEVEVLAVGLDITLRGGEAWSDVFPCAGVSGASSAATGGNCPPGFSQYIHEH
jgi:hypothetical protein